MVVETVVQVVRDVVAALVAVTGVVVAIVGLQTWRRQLRGSVELETARLVLRASYRMRDTIISVVFSSFMSERHDLFAPLRKKGVFERVSQRYTEDWKAVMDSGSELRLAELEGVVLWGKPFTAAMEPLKKCVRDLSAAHDESLHSRESEASEETQPRKYLNLLALGVERAERQPLTFSSGLAALLSFQRRVESAIKCLEDFVRPRMELRR